jgi:hypothetical protein
LIGLYSTINKTNINQRSDLWEWGTLFSDKHISADPQDSKLRKKNLALLDSGFNIQDSRLRKNFLGSSRPGFKIQGSRLKSPWILDFFPGFLNLESSPLGFRTFFPDLEY